MNDLPSTSRKHRNTATFLMQADTLFYAPTGSGMRVRMLESPTRAGDGLLCVAVFEGGPIKSHEGLAKRVIRQLSAPPFRVINTRLHRNAIYAPWDQRGAMRSALQSLLAHPQTSAKETVLRKQIDRNTMASVVGHGGGMSVHLFGPRNRKWRFAQFTLEETFHLFSMTWTAIDESGQLSSAKRARVAIHGGLNTPTERARMAERLAQGTGLHLE